MPDAPQEGDSSLAVTQRVNEQDFVQAFEVADGRKVVRVAANKIANRAQAQINVGRLRAMGDKVIELYTKDGVTPSAKEFKAIVDGIAVIEDIAERAYSDSKTNGGLSNSIERLIAAATAGAAAGAVAGGKLPRAASPEGRLARLRQIGKKRPPEIVVPAATQTDAAAMELE